MKAADHYGELFAFSSGNSFPFHFSNGPRMDSAHPTVEVGVWQRSGVSDGQTHSNERGEASEERRTEDGQKRTEMKATAAASRSSALKVTSPSLSLSSHESAKNQDMKEGGGQQRDMPRPSSSPPPPKTASQTKSTFTLSFWRIS